MIEVFLFKNKPAIWIYARAGSRKEEIRVFDKGLRVSVHAPPEKGKANEAIEKLVSQALGLKKRQCSIVKGESSSRKVMLIEGCDASELQSKLDTL